MKRKLMNRWSGSVLAIGAGVVLCGCVSLKAPERINIDGGHHVEDTSNVPPTSSHEEARAKLAEAYREINYLRAKVEDLKEDKKELKRERDHWKDRCDD